MQPLPFVSIIFPTRNNAADTLATLASLEKLDYPKERLEVLVWDNGSTDDSVARIKGALSSMEAGGWGGLQVVENEENLGIYPARDRAFRLRDPRASYIFCIDDDVELEPGCLREMLEVFELHQEAGVVGARVVYFDRPEMIQSAAHHVDRLTGRYTHTKPASVVECDFVIGCGALIKAEAFGAVDGFDDTYFMSHGEVDFCLRAKQRGYQVFYAPEALMRHRVVPGGRRSPERLYYLYRNKFHILRRHLSGPGRLLAIWGLFLVGLPKAYLDALRRHGSVGAVEWRTIGRAFWDGFRGYSGWRASGDDGG